MANTMNVNNNSSIIAQLININAESVFQGVKMDDIKKAIIAKAKEFAKQSLSFAIIDISDLKVAIKTTEDGDDEIKTVNFTDCKYEEKTLMNLLIKDGFHVKIRKNSKNSHEVIYLNWGIHSDEYGIEINTLIQKYLNN